MWTDHALALITTVALLAVVQSLFGVGLLLFGTPILLLVGIPFAEVLAYTLPCSIVISSLQLATSGGLTLEPIRRQFLIFTAPIVLVATGIALAVGSPKQLKVVVGIVLLVTAVTRLGPSRRLLSNWVRRHTRPLMVLLGAVHGWSNLGGGILTVIVGASFDDKVSIRRHIAFAYGVMATIQLTVVFATKRPDVQPLLWILLPVIAGSVYLLVGQRTFRMAREHSYQYGLTALIAGFGAVLVATV
jgi:uncharacterized protein